MRQGFKMRVAGKSTEQGIKRQTRADHPWRAAGGGVKGNKKWYALHQRGRDAQEDFALAQRFAHEPEMRAFEIAQTAVDEFAGTAGCAAAERLPLQQQRRVSRGRGGLGHADAMNAAADDDNVVGRCRHPVGARRENSWSISPTAKV